MNTSKIKPEVILVMILGLLAIFAPVIIKTKSISRGEQAQYCRQPEV